MSDAKIKVIIKRPDEKAGHVTNISASLKNLQKTVEGNIETVTVVPDPKVIMICNEEGKIQKGVGALVQERRVFLALRPAEIAVDQHRKGLHALFPRRALFVPQDHIIGVEKDAPLHRASFLQPHPPDPLRRMRPL